MKNKILLVTLSFTLLALLLITLTNTVSAVGLWNVQLTNREGVTTEISYNELNAMPKTTVSATLWCYNALVASGDWTGVQLAEVLARAGPIPTDGSIHFTAQDGYSISIPIETAMKPDTIIALDNSGSPLGEITRLVIPEANGNIWISSITSISMSRDPAALSSMWDPTETSRAMRESIENNQTTQQKPTPTPQPTKSTAAPTPQPSTSASPTGPPENVPQTNKQTNYNEWLIYGFEFAILFAAVAIGGLIYKRKRV